MAQSNERKWTIAIRPASGKPLHKITKIIGLNGEGFSVVMPYHTARSGFLFKQAVDPAVHLTKAGTQIVPWDDIVGFTAEDRAKLSYHVDGFVQFSSESPGKILSGRDPKTGEPKGLGLLARPLSRPSQSGPSIAVSIWGIEDFQTIEQQDELIIFEPNDFYYRKWKPSETNTWVLHVYVFPVDAVPPVRFEGDQSVMNLALQFPTTAGVVGSVVKMKTIRLEAERVHLGLYVECWAWNWPSKSGWFLNGPGDWTLEKSGHVLGAVYPRDLVPVHGRPSLDYPRKDNLP